MTLHLFSLSSKLLYLANDVDVPIEPNLEEYVQTPEFNHHLGSNNDSVTSATTIESTPYEVPEIEANLYYSGVGPKGHGPRLIYRTSDDKFEEPYGPEAYGRLMRVVAIPDSHEFGQNGVWDTVRDQVVELLNQRNIKVSSVDFVRFTWLNKKADQEIEVEDNNDDNDDNAKEEGVTYNGIPPIQPVEDGERHYTNPTIWIGVLPETLTGAVAHESSKDICAFLDSLRVQNVDIAYRESVYKTLSGHGPALFRPVEDGDPLKDIIDNVSVPLSLPIAGCETNMQGILGPYFHVGAKLYAITVRHNILPNEDNELYRYHESAPKKEVLVMGAPVFAKFLVSIQLLIGTYIDLIESLENEINTLRTRVQDGINVQESQIKLHKRENKLAEMRTKINNLNKFFGDIKKRWSKSKDRVIGFVCWAPPIGAGVAPHRYTRDLCVIELYKEKFKHMIGNVLSLGPELSPWKLKALMYERINVPSKFKYPDDGLLTLGGMLTADQHGSTTNTTIGTLTRFMSFVRKYGTTGNVESLEVPILSHEDMSGTFSKGGDSGSLIVSAHGEFVALLHGGTNMGTDGSDITFATLFEFVWDLVKEEFPDANLYFDNLQEFLADVV
ncbi:hypothetical protein H4582DRAFT_2121947 [Lactarius indigo]|nr:hypothetical protein H4582DRAFT_2121947 [Lactarius indigo]